jgi:hypothetical protein
MLGNTIRLLALFTLVATFSPVSPAFGESPQSSIARGVAWLQGQVQPKGNLTAEGSSMATPFQTREEVLVTLGHLGTAPSSLIGIVASNTDANVEYTARRITGSVSAGQADGSDVAALESTQNADGGWGLAPGYQSDSLDTAFALVSLCAMTAPNSVRVSAAMNYIRGNQLIDGGWGGQASSVYVTGQVLLAAQASPNSSEAGPIKSAATSWLVAQQISGTYGDSLDDSWALGSLSTQAVQSANLDSLITALIAEQSADGSWSEDPYLTAVALRALAYAQAGGQQQPSATGRVIDGASGNPLGQIPLTLISAGGGTIVGATASDGTLLFGPLSPGGYNLNIATPDFVLFDQAFTVVASAQTNLGDLPLVWSSAPINAIVRGTVLDATTAAPLMGVTVSIGSSQAVTNAIGQYEIVGVAPATYTATATSAG